MDPFFIYLLKSGGIILLFFIAYRLLLQQETFFTGNRYFLLSGIAVALLLPFLIFTKTVYVDEPQTIVFDPVNTVATNSLSSFGTIDWAVVFPLVYWVGVCIFFGRFVIQLLSLLRLMLSSTIAKEGKFYMVVTKTEVTPFSFFNYIVYHPGSHSEQELDTIITHEKIHARQWHSIDILTAHLLTVFLWFIPFAWIYKRCITQNLEYTADNEAVQNVQCRKNYQYLLLNASAKAYQPAITNNFFNSLIKKRIVMLNKNRSKQQNMWRYGIILPFLLIFLLMFNVKTIAQVKVVKKDNGHNVNVVRVEHFSINKNTTNEGLSKLKAKIKDKKGKFSYKDLERNSDGEITSITIEFKDDKGRFVSGNYSDDDGIAPIMFGANEKGLFISAGKSHGTAYGSGEHSGRNIRIKKHMDHDEDSDEDHDHNIVIVDRIGKGKGKNKRKKIKVKELKHGDGDAHEEHIEHIDEMEDGDVIIIEKEGKGDKGKEKKVHKIRIGDNDGKSTVVLGDSDGDPLILVDGKEIKGKKMKDMDTDDIEKIEVIKGDKATEKYGKKGKDGVILITTKKD